MPQFTCSYCRHESNGITFPFVCRCGTRDFGPNSTRPPTPPSPRLRFSPENIVVHTFYGADGVGTELHKIVKEKGYDIEGECNCPQVIYIMNAHGPEWCKANTKSYIVPEMVKEARRRNVVVTVPITGTKITPTDRCLSIQATRWVRQAIQAYRKTAPTAK